MRRIGEVRSAGLALALHIINANFNTFVLRLKIYFNALVLVLN
jgi:hypothetical protein